MQVLPTLILVMVVLFITANGRRTDKCSRKYKLCGDNKCCCKANKAICKQFYKQLDYIPCLPANITILAFQSNYLPNVTQETFKRIEPSRISSLALTYNDIVNISEDAFSGFTNITDLQLSGNTHINLTQLSLSVGSIPKDTNISLRLQSMELTEIPDDFFRPLSRSNVSSIHLDYNKLKTLNITIFQQLQGLLTLFIQGNMIREVYTGTGHKSLEYINLDENEIARCSPTFCSGSSKLILFPNLRRLSLRNNFINELTNDSWKCLFRLEKLSISGNVVRIIKANTFKPLRNLQSLALAEMHGSIDKIQSYAFSNPKLKYLTLQGNSIVFKSNSTIGMFKGCNNLKSLDLSHNNLRQLSDDDIVKMLSPLTSLEKLTLIRVQISHIPKNFVNMFRNLSHFYLDGNNIHELGKVFLPAQKLSVLSLQSNDIRVVPETPSSKLLLASVQTLNLGLNPFDCTCEMLWFRSIIRDNGKIGNMTLQNWPRNYACWSPSDKRKTLFANYHPNSNVCKKIMLISMVALASVLLVCVVSLIVSYRYRWYIAYLIYKIKLKLRRRSPEESPLFANDCHFDGYVIYESADEHFVHNDLLHFMETKNNYNMHIWERNSKAGKPKVDEMADSIYESDYVIAIISNKSLRNSWVRFQVNVALDRQVELKRDFLILVIMDDIELRQLSRYWCVLFTRLPCAHWCSNETDVRRKVFEQRLVQHFGVLYTRNNTV